MLPVSLWQLLHFYLLVFSSFLSKLLCVLYMFSLCMQISIAPLNVLYPDSVSTHYPYLPFDDPLKSWLRATHFILEIQKHFLICEYASYSFVYVPVTSPILSRSHFKDPFKKRGAGVSRVYYYHKAKEQVTELTDIGPRQLFPYVLAIKQANRLIPGGSRSPWNVSFNPSLVSTCWTLDSVKTCRLICMV